MPRKIKIVLILIGLPLMLLAENFFTNVINVSADSMGYTFIVDKRHQKMFLVKSPAPAALKIINEYKITTGRKNGDKEREGDLKTPEGVYYISGRVPESKLTPKFGPIAFTLDYPNFVDRLQKRNGSNIWIHGRDEAIKDFLTEGCISLENGQVLSLKKYIVLTQTPIVILDDLSDYTTEAAGYQTAVENWSAFTNGWAESWDSGAIPEYCDYYAPGYRDEGGRNLRQFRAYKTELENRYKWKKVAVDRISVLVSDHEAHVSLRQRYLSPTFYSEGEKRLVLVPVKSEWKIIKETFKPYSPRISTEEIIARFLEKWEQAWEAQDIEAYMQFYAPNFTSGDHNLDSWRKYKTELFQTATRIKVECSQLKVQTTQKQTWNITFRQVYEADEYRDVGWKTMTIVGFPGELKILKEEWSESH
jgi:murein L,D-transpeptidase YafK